MEQAVPQRIAFFCALIPFACVHTTWFIASMMENLHWCNPYWHSCHSISATGRQYPEFFVFKAIMLPVATLMLIYWLLVSTWLQRLQVGNGIRKSVTILGCIASIALVLYSVTLGALGETYGLARRIGIVFFFVGTSFAHLVLLQGLTKLKRQNNSALISIEHWITRMTYICAVLVIGSMINGLLGFFWESWGSWDNAFEWSYSLVMISLFYIVSRMWRETEFRIAFSINTP